MPFINDAGSEPSSAGTIAASQAAAFITAIASANAATDRLGMPTDRREPNARWSTAGNSVTMLHTPSPR